MRTPEATAPLLKCLETIPAETAGQRADVSAPAALAVSSDADVESAAKGRERVRGCRPGRRLHRERFT